MLNPKKILIGLIIFVAALYSSACLYLYFSQDKILFPARKTPVHQKFYFDVPFEEVWIDSDSAKLHGLYFHADTPKGVIIFFHGNAEKNDEFGKSAKEFTSQGFDYFVPDYRGYGKSMGRITSEKQFLADSERIFEWVKQKYPENKIALAGRSLGAVSAAYLASKSMPRLVVLIAPFFNIAAMADIRYPVLPKFLVRYAFRNDLWISQIKSPVYLIHGTLDTTIPPHQSARLFSKIRSPRRYFSVPGAGHSNLQDFSLYHQILFFLMNNAD